MTPKLPKTQWAGRSEFAEYAEAIGVPTDHIMAASEIGGDTVVMYSKDVTTDPPVIFGVKLARSPDGVLRQVTSPRELPGMWEEIQRNVEQKVTQRFGQPDRRKPDDPDKNRYWGD